MSTHGEQAGRFLCEEPSCSLHVPVPAGAIGCWAEIEIKGQHVTVTWSEVSGRRYCSRCAAMRLGVVSPADNATEASSGAVAVAAAS